MAKTKEQLEAELTAAQQRIAELEGQVAAGGSVDHTGCDRRLSELQSAKDELQGRFTALETELTTVAAARDAAVSRAQAAETLLDELDDDKVATVAGPVGVDVELRRSCGGLEAKTLLGTVLLRKGVEMNFLVDAWRSGIAGERFVE